MSQFLNSPPQSITPEQEEELRAYGRAMGEMNLGQTGDMMAAGSPWRVLLGALRGVQSRSAIDAAESSRAGRRTRQSLAVPGVVSLSHGTGIVASAPISSSIVPRVSVSASTAPTSTGALHPRYVDTLISIESGGNPRAITGSFRGLGQFSRDLEARYGITDWTNPDQQRSAILRHSTYLATSLARALGRQPTPGEIYLAHQQGEGGSVALLRAGAGETAFDALMRLPYYQSRGGAPVVRRAIENNLPPAMRGRWNTITASDFAGFWTNRFNSRLGVGAVTTSAPVSAPIAISASVSLPSAVASVPGAIATIDTPSIALAEASVTAPADIIATSSVPGMIAPSTSVQPGTVPPPGTELQPPVSGVGQPGYFAGGLPPNVPQRIQPDPALIAVLQRLRDPTSMNQADYNKALEEYQRLVSPRQIQTTYGMAVYNPLTGELQDFIPSGIIRRPVSVPGISTEQLLAPNASATAGGFSIAPIAPTPGLDTPVTTAPATGLPLTASVPPTGLTPRTSASLSSLPPSLTPNLPQFPESGDVGALATWGMQSGAIRSMIDDMAKTGATRIAAAQQASERASSRLNQLATIAALTEAASSTRWTGQALSDWQTRISQFLINFDPRSRGQRPEILQQLGYRELLGKLNTFLASEATQDISARGTNFEFGQLLQANPNLASSYEGTMMILSYMRQEQEHIAQLGEMASMLSPSQYGNWPRIVREYYRENPVIIEIPPTTAANGVVTPGRRITTAPIPRVGSIRPDGQSTWTRAQVLEYIRTLPPDVWFIDPSSGRLLPTRPPVRASASVSAR